MRVRKKKHGSERLAAAGDLLCTDKTVTLADPIAPFGIARSALHLEIGCGKGKFSVGMAVLHPDINFYAVERVSDVVVAAVERAMAEEVRPENLRFIVGDAKTLTEWFPPHTFDCIYLNFSDPWPKARHAKRRLTYRGRLQNYKKVLKPDGFIEFKTDNEGLFAFTLEEIEACGYEMIEMSRDLHGEAQGVHGEKSRCFMTEYEEKFSGQGKNINFVRF